MAEPAPRGERIAKWLARAGVASRRDAERLVAEGHVKLNNTTVTHPATFVAAGDLVVVNGVMVDAPERTRLWRRSQAGGPGDHASRSAGAADGVRATAAGPAAGG